MLRGDSIVIMEIQLKLYGSSKLLSEKGTLLIKLPENSKIEQLRDSLEKIISEKHSKSNLGNLSKTAAFFSEKDEVINDNYQGDIKSRIYFIKIE